MKYLIDFSLKLTFSLGGDNHFMKIPFILYLSPFSLVSFFASIQIALYDITANTSTIEAACGSSGTPIALGPASCEGVEVETCLIECQPLPNGMSFKHMASGLRRCKPTGSQCYFINCRRIEFISSTECASDRIEVQPDSKKTCGLETF